MSSAATDVPTTKLWYLSLKPGYTVSNEEFRAVCAKILDWTKAKSGTQNAAHQLWQHVSHPEYLVFLTGWPSDDARRKAFEDPQEKEFEKEISKFLATQGIYKQVNISVTDIPLSAPILSIETFSIAPTDEKLFETKVTEAQRHVAENTKAIASVGGWDVFPELGPEEQKSQAQIDPGKGLPKMKQWISFTGWNDEETHVETAKEVVGEKQDMRQKVEAARDVFDTVHVKKVLG